MTSPRWVPDNSAIACFRENPEQFRLRYRLHLAPASPDDKMRAGSAIHAGRNVLYEFRRLNAGAAYPEAVIEAAVAAGRAHRGDGLGPRNADQVELVIRTYAAKYASEPFAVVESERYVEAKIVCASCAASSYGPVADCSACFDFCGIIDGVIAFPDESVYVKDLKSTGAYLNESWEQACRLGDQFVGYVALRRALGLRCDGFFVDGIQVKDAKPRKDGTLGTPGVSEDDFVRIGPVSVPEWRVERWAQDLRYTLAQIAALEASRGLDVPWPIYQNWPYGKVGPYREFYETPVELHGSVAQMFERKEWSPKAVADERKAGA